MSSTGSAGRSPTELEQHIPGSFPSGPAQTSTPQSLAQAVHARRAEYTRPQKIRIKVGSWNVASYKGTEKDLGGWFVGGRGVSEALDGIELGRSSEDRAQLEGVQEQEQRRTKEESTLPKKDPGAFPGGDEIGIYVLGLQEVVDINSAAEALRPYSDPSVPNKYKRYLQDALPPGYTLVAEQQLIGLLLLIYVSPSVYPNISPVSTTSVGTGLMGYMGNKGAVTARLVLGESTRLVFVNCHLSAGTEKGAVERRNWDVAQILSRTRFDPISDSTGYPQAPWEVIGDEDFAFWLGDLNYRIVDIPGEDVRRLLMLHIRKEYGVEPNPSQTIDKTTLQASALKQVRQQKARGRASTESSLSSNSDTVSAMTRESADEDGSLSSNTTLAGPDADLDPHSDPTSLQTAISSLLPHDELYQQQKARKVFHDGWKEGPITFLPTYKYDVGTIGELDSSEKRRAPSWCDRVLYRSRRDKLAFESQLREEDLARKKDEEMKANGVDTAAADEDLLFEYNPETDADDGENTDDRHAVLPPEVVVTRHGFEDDIRLEHYTAHHRVLSSDHKPLDAVFTVKYDAVDPDLKAKVHQEVARELDKAENEGRPTVTIVVDKHYSNEEDMEEDAPGFEGVNFYNVRYGQMKVRSITIANTGQSRATFTFIERPVGDGQTPGVTPPWLSLRFDRDPDETGATTPLHNCYSLDPGEACNVELILQVKVIEQARELNEGTQTLEDVLVLRVVNGRDHFLPIRGRWHRTSFGSTIEKLIRIPEGGIRWLQRQKPSGSHSLGTDRAREIPDDEHGVKWSAPRELFRLTEALEDLVERTLAEWSMTRSPDSDKAPWEANAGWPFAKESSTLKDSQEREALFSRAVEALDTDEAFTDALPPNTPVLHRLEVLAEVFVAFLDSLEDGVITEKLWTDLDNQITAHDKAKKRVSNEDERFRILNTLSSQPHHNVSFILITSMLSRMISEITSAQTTIVPSSPKKNDALPASTRATVRRKTLSADPAVARRQLIEKEYAAIYGDILIKAPLPTRDKERRAALDRRQHIIEIFLQGH